MEVLKTQLLVTVILTQIASLYFGDVPYFPIEVSRTAASSKLGLFVFRVGMCSSITSLLFYYRVLAYNHFFAWVSLVTIAVFDDIKWPAMHVVGLVMLATSGTIAAYTANNGAYLVCLAALLTIIRLAVRGLAILKYESNDVDVYEDRMWSLKRLVYRCILAFRRSAHIMKTGQTEQKVLIWFRVSGVLQWVTFFVLARMYQ